MASRSMDNKKDDKYYAQKAIENISTIQRYINGKSYEEFLSDEELIDAVMFRLTQTIENIKNIGAAFKENNPQIPWGDIIGFRNGIVHEYGKTDFLTVYETAANDIRSLKEALQTII